MSVADLGQEDPHVSLGVYIKDNHTNRKTAFTNHWPVRSMLRLSFVTNKFKMKKIILLVLVLTIGKFFAQVPNLVYSNTYATSGNVNDYCSAVISLSDNNVAMTGYCQNMNPLGMYPTNYPLSSNSFVGKFNAVGSPLWLAFFYGTPTQLAKDATGNIYMIGYASGSSSSFGGVPYGNTGNNSLNANNILIAKYSANGALLWAKVVGGSGDDFGTGIATDPSGNVYIAGYSTFGTAVLDFDPSNTAATFTASYKSYLVKLTTNGNYVWHRYMPSNQSTYHSVCADANNVYIATVCYGTNLNINPASTAYTLNTNAGTNDIVLMKFRNNGSLVSAKSIGGTTNTDYPRSLEVLNNRLALVGAITSGSAAINMNGLNASPAVNLYSNANLNKDGFVAIYDTTALTCQWARSLGSSTANDEVWGAHLDNNGNVLVSGQYCGTTSFNSGFSNPMTANSTNTTSADLFYACYSVLTSSCNWVYYSGTTGADNAADITADNSGRIWVTGVVNNASNGTGNDVFLRKHACTASYVPVVKHNSNALSPYVSSYYQNNYAEVECLGQASIISVSVTPQTNLKVSMTDFSGAMQATTSVVITPTTNMGNKGIRMLLEDTVNHCETLLTYFITQVNNPPANLIITASNINICAGGTVQLTTSLGNTTHTWMPGNLVTNGNNIIVTPTINTTYTATIFDAVACYWSATKIVTLAASPTVIASASQNTICPGQSTSLTASGANTYSWSNLFTQASQQVSPSVTTVYNVTGSSNGCSATVSLTITVNPMPAVSIAASATQMCNGEAAILTASGAQSYTWSGGASGSTIMVSPTLQTTYTVTGSDGVCENSNQITLFVSDCTGISESGFTGAPLLYPNPANTCLILENTGNGEKVMVFDLSGKVVLEQALTDEKTKLDVSAFDSSIYLLKIEDGKGRSTRAKFVKE